MWLQLVGDIHHDHEMRMENTDDGCPGYGWLFCEIHDICPGLAMRSETEQRCKTSQKSDWRDGIALDKEAIEGAEIILNCQLSI